jgi:hypothetical protein
MSLRHPKSTLLLVASRVNKCLHSFSCWRHIVGKTIIAARMFKMNEALRAVSQHPEKMTTQKEEFIRQQLSIVKKASTERVPLTYNHYCACLLKSVPKSARNCICQQTVRTAPSSEATAVARGHRIRILSLQHRGTRRTQSLKVRHSNNGSANTTKRKYLDNNRW